MTRPPQVQAYLDAQPEAQRAGLESILETLHGAVPDAEEVISYGIPTLRHGGRNVVHCAGWATHLAVYPIPQGDEEFQAAVAPYRHGRGTLRFPLGASLPLDLIGRLAALLLAERQR